MYIILIGLENTMLKKEIYVFCIFMEKVKGGRGVMYRDREFCVYVCKVIYIIRYICKVDGNIDIFVMMIYFKIDNRNFLVVDFNCV